MMGKANYGEKSDPDRPDQTSKGRLEMANNGKQSGPDGAARILGA